MIRKGVCVSPYSYPQSLSSYGHIAWQAPSSTLRAKSERTQSQSHKRSQCSAIHHHTVTEVGFRMVGNKMAALLVGDQREVASPTPEGEAEMASWCNNDSLEC